MPRSGAAERRVDRGARHGARRGERRGPSAGPGVCHGAASGTSLTPRNGSGIGWPTVDSDPIPPYVRRPGDVVVPVPHTLTRVTRAGFDAAARAVLPSAASLSRAAPDPRLVLDARACTVVDADGLATLAALLRAAAANGVGAVIVDAAPDVARLLARSPAARGLTPAFAARPLAPAPTPEPPEPDAAVLPLDLAARERLTGRRRRRRGS